ncbi:MAG: energy transducer TonB [Gracilimonas sp.]|uniref:energy transducer TonB n=1 Tax=Gracilimonas TaxID=649462 RepID=UPI001B29BC6B|nr:energy transducer TonB [Gracilimonas sp.]MBO6584903.1 energy transducer TonB [Gracilimonas sp.]MBO6615826.1 energy transducer TonB [Gracilimonas sp.]
MSKIINENVGLIACLLFVASGCGYFDFSADPRFCDEVNIVVEKMPQLIGGMSQLQESVEYPAEAKEAGIEGRVTVQFVVNKLGQTTRVQIIRGIGGGADEAAVSAVEEAKFEPGKHNGKPVCVQYALPINFRLES